MRLYFEYLNRQKCNIGNPVLVCHLLAHTRLSTYLNNHSKSLQLSATVTVKFHSHISFTRTVAYLRKRCKTTIVTCILRYNRSRTRSFSQTLTVSQNCNFMLTFYDNSNNHKLSQIDSWSAHSTTNASGHNKNYNDDKCRLSLTRFHIVFVVLCRLVSLVC